MIDNTPATLIEKCSGTPSAAAYASEQENCRAAGMDGHIAKPILLASLASEIGRWLPARAGALPEVA